MSSSGRPRVGEQRMPAAVAGEAGPDRGHISKARCSRYEYEHGKRVADVMVRSPKTHGPGSRLEMIRAFFEDDHVHMALIVAMDGRLITTIERSDLAVEVPGFTLARELGTLAGRTAGPTDALDAVTAALLRERRRRLAVVDGSGLLLGLLCLKKDETGYCCDEDIRERAERGAR